MFHGCAWEIPPKWWEQDHVDTEWVKSSEET